MIDFYYWTTPNGHKISILLEEAGLPYNLKPVNLGKGEQFSAEFLAISPNNKMPAIVDHDPRDGGEPITLFESGAILQYLAEKTGRFLPQDLRARMEVMVWLFWQVGGLGPMLGQNLHFLRYAPEKIPYAIARYRQEAERLYRVLDGRLAERVYLCADYSIADIAIYPWIATHGRQDIDISAYPNVARWLGELAMRPAVMRAYALAKAVNPAS